MTWIIIGPYSSDIKSGTTIIVDPGDYPGKISISVYPTAVPSRIASQELWTVRLTVMEASLVSGGGGFAEVVDDEQTKYPRPLWTRDMDPPFPAPAKDVMPVQYRRNGTVAMDAKFRVEPYDWNGSVRVKTEGGFILEATDFSACSGDLTVFNMPSECFATLPNYVDWQKNKTCNWKCSVDGGTYFGDAQASRHAYYATLKQPVEYEHTVVHLACKKIRCN